MTFLLLVLAWEVLHLYRCRFCAGFAKLKWAYVKYCLA
ncbi:hypothetical protein PORCRE_694 [Porphyromonas crevioricanis JCM 15906]|uniref:Uncharacterized protein n=1 Tax=Porphyromonas crevioricanis JCM 15906 TaxID=1305617 RepID=T1CMN1_9PORP|nr:hypothetical protein PORCRE_694 [Porphyromonas crevioricanis JCM 15906]GAD08522.1 hypothetical protein PORCAN_2170 [Porphyromonas crevioricanis JCM 13913]